MLGAGSSTERRVRASVFLRAVGFGVLSCKMRLREDVI